MQLDESSEYIRDRDAVVFLDTFRPNLLTFATLCGLDQVELETDITAPLMLNSSTLTFWSKKHSAVFQYCFESNQLNFVALASVSPTATANLVDAGDILICGPNLLPLAAMLTLDPTISSIPKLSALNHDFLRALRSSTLLETSSQSSSMLYSPSLTARYEAPALSFYADSTGTLLYTNSSTPIEHIIGTTLDLHEYLASGAVGFFQHATALTLPDFDSVDLEPLVHALQVFPQTKGFLVQRTTENFSKMYHLDASFLVYRGLLSAMPLQEVARSQKFCCAQSGLTEDFLYAINDDTTIVYPFQSTAYPSSADITYTTRVQNMKPELLLDNQFSFWGTSELKLASSQIFNLLYHGQTAHEVLPKLQKFKTSGQIDDAITSHTFKSRTAYSRQLLTPKAFPAESVPASEFSSILKSGERLVDLGDSFQALSRVRR
jgi:hypothetical protein